VKYNQILIKFRMQSQTGTITKLVSANTRF